MKTPWTDKIYDALQVFDNTAKYREILAEAMLDGAQIFDESIPINHEHQRIDEALLMRRSSDLKKILAAARKIAQATGDAEVEEETSYEIAAAADDSVERVKQAALYAKGEIEYEDLTDHLIGRAVARLIVVTNKAIDLAADSLPAILGRIPTLAPLVPIVTILAGQLKPAIKKFVEVGIRSVAERAKKLVSKVKIAITELTHSAVEKLRKWATA